MTEGIRPFFRVSRRTFDLFCVFDFVLPRLIPRSILRLGLLIVESLIDFLLRHTRIDISQRTLVECMHTS